MSGHPIGRGIAGSFRVGKSSGAGDVNPGNGSLAPARLRDVRDRLRTGAYDRPEVLRHVAERVAGELLARG